MKNLECSSKGDKRFSAFYAKVKVNNKISSIEEIYQLSKIQIVNGVIKCFYNIKDVKGKKVDGFVVNGKIYEAKYLTQWYNLLWVKYLDNNKDLVKYASEFDSFSDMFRGKAINCQADVIEKYVKEGREVVIKECKKLLDLMRG